MHRLIGNKRIIVRAYCVSDRRNILDERYRLIARAIDVGDVAGDHRQSALVVRLTRAVDRLVQRVAGRRILGQLGQRSLEQARKIAPPKVRRELVAHRRLSIDRAPIGAAKVNLQLLPRVLRAICCIKRPELRIRRIGDRRDARVHVIDRFVVVRRWPEPRRRRFVARAVEERQLATVVDEELAGVQLIEVLTRLFTHGRRAQELEIVRVGALIDRAVKADCLLEARERVRRVVAVDRAKFELVGRIERRQTEERRFGIESADLEVGETFARTFETAAWLRELRRRRDWVVAIGKRIASER